MKRLIFLILLGLAVAARADIIYVQGDVSGTWSADTVMVRGEVRVPPDSTLVIEPGVKVLFQVYCKLIVDSAATLRAVGTPADSIRFDVLSPNPTWHGIRFHSASDSCRLEYCLLTHGWASGLYSKDYNGGAIYCNNSNPTIRANTISEDSCYLYGGGIYCSGSSPILSDNAITANKARELGGGIYCESNSSPVISDNIISANLAYAFGGIACLGQSDPVISGNTIVGNSADYGGGIGCDNSNPTISSNTITGDTAVWTGGGIYCHFCSPIIEGNSISGNSTEHFGGGIYCNDAASPSISGNNINGNSAFSGGGIYCRYSSPVICNNTIRQNSGSYDGGICCYHSNPQISDNTISGNFADYSAGGIVCLNSSPSIVGNSIEGNSVSSNFDVTCGGGIYCYENSNPDIFGNTIRGNWVYSYLNNCWGAGIACGSNSSPSIRGNIISGNFASTSGVLGDAYGGGISCQDISSPIISGNTISENLADWGGGLFSMSSSNSTLVNCIIWGNSTGQIGGSNFQVTYSDVQDTLWLGEGNISLDPLFVDPANGDYHLQSTVGSFHGGLWLPDPLHSPCIDAGDPDSAFANEPLPNGGRINMGFEGNTAEASLSTITSAPKPIAEISTEFCLYDPYPNPFNAAARIRFDLPMAGHVKLEVFDIFGRSLASGSGATPTIEGWREAGRHEALFEGRDLPSGIYLCRLQAGEFEAVQKMVLIK